MDKTAMAVKVFDNHAASYQEKFMDVSLYHDALDLFCSCISKADASLLDVACGPGNITKYILGEHPGYKMLGIDLSPRMVELAKDSNPSAEFKVMDCRDVNTLGQKFDGIICGFCLPYLSKKQAIELIGDAAGMLNSNGALYVSTMEGDYNTSGIQTSSSGDQVYQYFHHAGYLSAALEQNGFEVVSLFRKDFVNPDSSSAVDLIIVAKLVVAE